MRRRLDETQSPHHGTRKRGIVKVHSDEDHVIGKDWAPQQAGKRSYLAHLVGMAALSGGGVTDCMCFCSRGKWITQIMNTAGNMAARRGEGVAQRFGVDVRLDH